MKHTRFESTRTIPSDRTNDQSQTPLYTEEQRKRRDDSIWTLVQGILAPVQFLVFLVSLALVWRFLATGDGYLAATSSIVIKTLVLYTIMITGSLWEKDVFGKYLFAGPFYWEDIVSSLVMVLHTAYVLVVVFGWLNATEQMVLALVAYTAYVINAAQYLIKFRRARLQPSPSMTPDNSLGATP
ncbi:MAG TPA: 2-vinyl bacteriochlorophyllide hydratase [Xanthomonadales bacterium]|nr:2-vinyl bacteriochlorophyllide hydratase [Xanthomonadales bacterium]